jgi:dihydrofolate reductase
MLSYTAIGSLDGYIADASGDFSWAEPSEEVHLAVNAIERGVSTMVLGRRTYEVLTVWDTWDVADEPPAVQEFKDLWLAADKVVVSRTLEAVSTARTTIARELPPLDGHCSIGGPTLAAEAFARGLVDEVNLFLAPVTVGGGLAALPAGLRLELVGQRSFPGGWVGLTYRP